MAQWIDCDDYSTKPGDIRYLVEVIDTSSGRRSFSLYDRPLRTNQNLQPRLRGWCGETNNRSKTASGVVRVARLNAAGDRAQVVQLRGSELAAFLEQDGYPELIPSEAT